MDLIDRGFTPARDLTGIIAKLRFDTDMSAAELRRQMGFRGKSRVDAIERLHAPINAFEVAALANVFGLRVDSLLRLMRGADSCVIARWSDGELHGSMYCAAQCDIQLPPTCKGTCYPQAARFPRNCVHCACAMPVTVARWEDFGVWVAKRDREAELCRVESERIAANKGLWAGREDMQVVA